LLLVLPFLLLVAAVSTDNAAGVACASIDFNQLLLVFLRERKSLVYPF
jgi:hypothetical protein